MIIEDDELRELYRTSSSEHLQKLEAELMQLEKNPQDTEALEEFLREAHTLKGDSRMLGLEEIEMLVHQIEDSVEGIKQGSTVVTSDFCDRIYQGLDAINHLAHTAITGEPTDVDTVEVLALLMGAESESSESGNKDLPKLNDELFEDDLPTIPHDDLDDESGDLFDSEPIATEASFFEEEEDLFSETLIAKTAEPLPKSQVFPVAKSVKVTPSVREHQIDTIRVDPQKLDILMTQASELTVTKLRISQQLSDINNILNLWSEWEKDTSNNLIWFEQIVKNLS